MPSLEKAKFFLKLNRLIKEEGRSNYARFLFQENIISLYIIAALQSIEAFLNNKIVDAVLTGNREIKHVGIIEIKFDIEELERKTLGQLCYVIYPYLKNDKRLEAYLKRFVKLRNSITHKMLNKYNNFEELEEGLTQVVKIGGKAVEGLGNFIDKFDYDIKK